MKKIISASILGLMLTTSAFAADNYSFEPVEISAPAGNTVSPAPATTTVGNPVKAPATNTPTNVDTLQSESFQNALMQLDSAQVDMRDKLLEYKNQFAEIDAQYVKYKTERANMKKTISQTEKKIKNIDRYKKSIRKEMI